MGRVPCKCRVPGWWCVGRNLRRSGRAREVIHQGGPAVPAQSRLEQLGENRVSVGNV